MEITKVYETAKEVIDIASKKFRPVYIVNEASLKVFEKICNAFDTTFEELQSDIREIKSYEVRVNDVSLDISIIITIDGFFISRRQKSTMTKLIKCADKVKITRCSDDEDFVDVEFVYPSVWERL